MELTTVSGAACYSPEGRCQELGTDSCLCFFSWQLVKHGATMNKSSRGELYISGHFVSEKKPRFQKLMKWVYRLSLCANWTWVTVDLHDWEETQSAFQKCLPWKASQRSFFSLASFLSSFCCRAPGRSSCRRNWDTGEISIWHFPISCIWVLSFYLHAQYWILSISTSEYNICRRGRQWELPLGYYSDSYLFSILMKN